MPFYCSRLAFFFSHFSPPRRLPLSKHCFGKSDASGKCRPLYYRRRSSFLKPSRVHVEHLEVIDDSLLFSAYGLLASIAWRSGQLVREREMSALAGQNNILGSEQGGGGGRNAAFFFNTKHCRETARTVF